ncbi:hypothetical protein GGQ73_004649 [Rhizobium skierniewicense]|uniref:Uncharacterized protein n=1 Tax=Rhizobium skierniewicense TaxID=984260 RepID=A0A7W6CE67_9HYPH|nr:hypothetical protein [Rhizobium skierniewicense]
MPTARVFDGFVEHTKRVSPTHCRQAMLASPRGVSSTLIVIATVFRHPSPIGLSAFVFTQIASLLQQKV